MITAAQLRAARALLGIDQRKLAELSGLSLPTIQRMEASDGVIRGNVDSLMKLVTALDSAGIELIGDMPQAPAAAAACGSRGRRHDAAPRIVVCRGAARDRNCRGVDTRRDGERVNLRPMRDGRTDLAVCRLEASARSRTGREMSYHSAFRGSARIFASTRYRRFFSPLSISAPSPQACSRSAMAAMRPRRYACCRSIRPSSPA